MVAHSECHAVVVDRLSKVQVESGGDERRASELEVHTEVRTDTPRGSIGIQGPRSTVHVDVTQLAPIAEIFGRFEELVQEQGQPRFAHAAYANAPLRRGR